MLLKVSDTVVATVTMTNLVRNFIDMNAHTRKTKLALFFPNVFRIGLAAVKNECD